MAWVRKGTGGIEDIPSIFLDLEFTWRPRSSFLISLYPYDKEASHYSIFEIGPHDGLVESIERFSFLTNQQQPNFKRTNKIVCHARDKLTFPLFSDWVE